LLYVAILQVAGRRATANSKLRVMRRQRDDIKIIGGGGGGGRRWFGQVLI